MVVGQQTIMSPKEYTDSIPCKTGKDFLDISKDEECANVISPISEIKVYKRRWVQLVLFVCYSALNNLQCLQFVIINNVISRFYNVSSFAVNWTSMIVMTMYIVMIFPALYMMQGFGLKWIILMGGTGTCIAAWIKYFSSCPDCFVYVFIAQGLIGMSQVFVLSIPGRLAAYWFGPDQVATATSIACFGIQLGISSCYLLTTMFVKNHENIEDIGRDLSAYFFWIAVVSTVVAVALVLFFQNEPSLPPSESRALQKLNGDNITESFWLPVKRIVRNKNFILLWHSYGIHLSVLGSLSTLMNQLYLSHFENGEEDVGRMGVGAVFLGGVGSAIAAYILDKTKRFRAITICLCLIGLFAEISFAICLMMEIKWMVILSGIILGTSLVSYSTMGFELCAEITYPESEGTANGILEIANQISTTLMVLVSSELIEIYGDKSTHMCMIAALLIGTILNSLDKGELRRQNAVQMAKYNAVSLQVLEPLKTE